MSGTNPREALGWARRPENASVPIRIYADTSVYGGCFDPEFARASNAFFDGVREGRFNLVVSTLVVEEVAGAPGSVRALFDELYGAAEHVDLAEPMTELRNAYLEAGILTSRSAADALHVATASATGCDVIVSWNFRHIVRFDRIPLYNAVNVLRGYRPLSIHSPLEVLGYGLEDI